MSMGEGGGCEGKEAGIGTARIRKSGKTNLLGRVGGVEGNVNVGCSVKRGREERIIFYN